MFDIEDDQVEEEAVLDELDGNRKARLFFSQGLTSVFQLKAQRKMRRVKARKMMNCLKSLQKEVKTPSSLLGSKETGHTSYVVTTSGCSGTPGTRTE
jgi:hypothetical protein